jgi:Ca-activated chloride channel family protein
MKRVLIVVLLLVSVLAITCTVRPRATNHVEGVVTDPSGSPLPGVTVVATAPSQPPRTVVTDQNGRYAFKDLPNAEYTVRYQLSGFKDEVRTRDDKMKKVVLRTGDVESITVTAEAPFKMTDRAAAAVYGGMVGGLAAGNIGAVADQKAQRAYVLNSPPPLPAMVEPPAANPNYVGSKENEFIEAVKETTTTFAIDVDRASYANVRRFLTSNQMPPAEAVRVEEMINYFSYAYPQPTGHVPFSVTTEVAGCPWNVAHRLVRIGIQGQNLDQWKAAPNNLVFLLDVSGSMMPPERLPLIKSAFRFLVDQLRPEDTVSIVVYAGAAGEVLPPTSGADKQTILNALDHLQAGGSTAGAAGIELAYQVAKDNFKEDGNNRVILATDGDFNVGSTSFEDLQKLIEDKRKSNIFLTCLGVGTDNYKDSMLELLADKGNGNYSYLDTPREAEKVFKRELTGTLVTIAKDVKVQLEFDPKYVASYRQIGYENRALANQDFADDTKDAGELGAGHSVTALYEIVPASNAAGTIAKLRLRYKEPRGETSRLIETSVNDEGKSVFAASPDMQFAAAIAEFGMLLRNSEHRGSATYAEALQLARAARGVDLDGDRDEFVRMVDAGRAMSGEAAPRVAGK